MGRSNSYKLPRKTKKLLLHIATISKVGGNWTIQGPVRKRYHNYRRWIRGKPDQVKVIKGWLMRRFEC